MKKMTQSQGWKKLAQLWRQRDEARRTGNGVLLEETEREIEALAE